ncbi:phasin family protein [Trinickia sp. NRRL B-1857]|uniref:phasin family protein n=1 Tax=Trinickia sp. NRRL B-1857 TaxID=3162879 RepID=UPI003D2E90F6
MSSSAIDYAGEAARARSAGQVAFASMADIANQTFDGFERLARLNLQTVKTTLAEQHGIALEAVDSRSIAWIVTLPTAQAQAGFKKALAYWQHLSAIASETAANNAGASWEGLSACTNWFASTYSEVARSRTGGTLVLASPDESLPVPAEEQAAMTAKGAAKKRSVEIVDGSGNVVSSVKQ